MNYPQYAELEKLICEYDEDSKTFQIQKLIMKNYPKVFIMSSASLFETQIKRHCQDFLDHPLSPLSNYPQIVACMNSSKPTVDKMYAKFETFDRGTGIERFDASKFYGLFGGQVFKSSVESFFTTEMTSQLQFVSDQISALLPLCGQERYDFDYAKYCDLKDELSQCTFNSAEYSFLSLKRKRNQVAHNYINALTDTFDDLRRFYIKAVVYVVSLEKAIICLTTT